MDQVRESLSESGTIMILTDPSGVILKTEGDPATLEAAGDVRLLSGVSWDELSSGTNAIGTALSLKEPVQIHATEHFCAGIKPWSCSAAVLRDPASGKENMQVDWRFRRGDTVKIRLANERRSFHAMQHPIHLHGQRFLVLAVNGVASGNFAWKDTALVPAGATVDLLVEMTNPGRWMMHCHIAEHLSADMMMAFTVE